MGYGGDTIDKSKQNNFQEKEVDIFQSLLD